MDVLLINALMYITTLIFVIRKYKRFNVYTLIWIAYTVVAVMGYISVKMEMHYSRDSSLGTHISIEPYVYAYLTVLLITYPFSRIKESLIQLDITFPPFFKTIIKIAVLFFFIQAVFNGITMYVVANTIGFGEAYQMGHEGEYVDVFGSYLLKRMLRYMQVFTVAITPFYMVYFFLRIEKNKGILWTNLLYILMAFLPSFFSSVASGSKGGLFFMSLNAIFYYLLFRRRLSSYVNRIFFAIGAFFIGIVLLYVMIISISRIETHIRTADSEQQTNEIVHYLGEAFPNLGYFYWNKVVSNPNGLRFFPEFSDSDIEEKYEQGGLDAKFEYWEHTTHVPMAMFKTFWGDWYVEFGLTGSFVAILVMYSFFYFGWLKNYTKFSNIGILSFYYTYVVIQGLFTGSGLEGSSKHKSILFIILISYILTKRMNNNKNSVKKVYD